MQSVLQYRRSERMLRVQINQHRDPQEATPRSILPPNDKPRSQVPGSGDIGQLIIVQFEENDGQNPKNWPFWLKLRTTLFVLGAGLVGGWTSSNDSSITTQAQASFRVGAVAESLSTGLYLFGFGVGSLVSGPFSETVGRNPIYLGTLILLMIFIMASALAPNIGAQLAFRFFAGVFGCTAVTTFAGSVADLWTPTERTLVFSLSSAANFTSVFLSPAISALIGQSPHINWCWTEWVALLTTALVTTLIALFAPETYAPVILSWKATQLRRLTGNPLYRSNLELRLDPLWIRLLRSIRRPFSMFVHEIAVALFTIYLTVIYIVAFTFLTGFSYIYGAIYHLSPRQTGLCFLSLDVGVLIGAALALPLHRKYVRDLAAAQAQRQQRLPAEQRLWFAMISAPCLPIGLFLMAWTSYPSIPLWSNLKGGVLIGFVFLGLFVATYLYLIDTFEAYAASALAIATFLRYVAAGGMVPVSIPMYENLGVHWTLTVLACISLILTPLPYAFYKYGHAIRAWSKRKREGAPV